MLENFIKTLYKSILIHNIYVYVPTLETHTHTDLYLSLIDTNLN